ncbi:MAG: hypothetical protein DWI04_04935 [Planctomycetota bacterium]|nr:MAG: hypothetical protein DWI04_04935 [Planctomycetota bacterium]
MPVAVGLPFLAALVTVVAACAGAFLARGTTAVPAAWWAGGAALAFAVESAVRASGGLTDPASQASARLAVAAFSLCPIMSLLGAKRPQHGVWQFIVASLAGIIALPAASAALVRPGSPPDVHALQRWFMLALVLVAAMNFAATRHGVAAMVVAVGQLILIRQFMPFVDSLKQQGAALDAVAAWLVATGGIVAAGQSWLWPAQRRVVGIEVAEVASRRGGGADLAAFDAAYLALRETLGAAWTLRIAERFNAVAESRGWPCRLSFDGLHVGGDPDDREWRGDALRTGRALLRRFVSTDWMRRHAVDGENR